MALIPETITPRCAYWRSPDGERFEFSAIAPVGNNQYALSGATLPQPRSVGIWELRSADDANARVTDDQGGQAGAGKLLAIQRVIAKFEILLPLIDPEVGDISNGEHLIEVGRDGGIAKYVITPRGDWLRFSVWVDGQNLYQHQNNGTRNDYDIGRYVPSGRDTNIRVTIDYNDGSYRQILWIIKPQLPTAPTQGSETTTQTVKYDTRTVAIAKPSVKETVGTTAVFYDYRHDLGLLNGSSQDFKFVLRYRGDRADVNLAQFSFTGPTGEPVPLSFYEASANSYSTFQPSDGWRQAVIGIQTASLQFDETLAGTWMLTHDGMELAQYVIAITEPPPPAPANLNDDWYMEEGLNVFGPETELTFELPDASGGEAYGPDSYNTDGSSGTLHISGVLSDVPDGMIVQVDAWDSAESAMTGIYADIAVGAFDVALGDAEFANYAPVIWAEGAVGSFKISRLRAYIAI